MRKAVMYSSSGDEGAEVNYVLRPVVTSSSRDIVVPKGTSNVVSTLGKEIFNLNS